MQLGVAFHKYDNNAVKKHMLIERLLQLKILSYKMNGNYTMLLDNVQDVRLITSNSVEVFLSVQILIIRINISKANTLKNSFKK
jgi:hypothetical protein